MRYSRLHLTRNAFHFKQINQYIFALFLFSDNVDVLAIKSLLSKIFLENSLESTANWIKSIPIESATKDLDLKMEVQPSI